MSRWPIALLALTGLLWACVTNAQVLTYVRLHFVCSTPKSAEYVAMHEWGVDMPEDCIRLGWNGNELLTREAEVHELVKIIALDDGRHIAVGRIFLPHSNYWGYSAGYTILYIS